MIIPAIWMSAIVYSTLISMLSLGFTLTYMTMKIPNFAHGTYLAFGIYVNYTLSIILNYSPYIAFPISFLLSGIISVATYIIVVNRLYRKGRGKIVLTISTIAIQIFLTSILYIYAYWLHDKYKTYVFTFSLRSRDFRVGGYQGIFPISIVICVIMVITLHYMLTRTKIGVAMKATAENSEIASIVGINTYHIQILSCFLTGGLAGLAGSMLPLWFISGPETGLGFTTTFMAGSLLGGLDNIYGAIVGGFIIGLSEIIGSTWMSNIVIGGKRLTWIGEYRPIIPMFTMIAILILEPRGLKVALSRARDHLMASKTWSRMIVVIRGKKA